MKRIFTRVIIQNAANMQHKRVMEATVFMLALTILCLGIAGFQTLLKQTLTVNSITTHEQKNLLTYIFPELRYSCSPTIANEDNLIWSGTCRSVEAENLKSYSVSIKSSNTPKKYKGFKLAKEVFYLSTKKDNNILGSHSALSISTFIVGGGTFIKISKSAKRKLSPIYMVGFGLGLAFHIDKKMQIEFKEIPPTIASAASVNRHF